MFTTSNPVEVALIAPSIPKAPALKHHVILKHRHALIIISEGRGSSPGETERLFFSVVEKRRPVSPFL